ncbi:hypothetical protein INS49_001595 [Diaporthe citri]|uniref:uncharacterized protein n=1 Tax=Diaporthe citri TaxID=83186 RepID=UPI001C813C5F|nr:uncharacterized protein INS49_001595 [Diaporthe citri]KAG6367406.1 hypothetical protein INS49_001595 [Diaporthe citri]
MPYSSSSDLGAGEQADAYSKDKLEQSPSPKVKLESQFEKSGGAAQDEKKQSLSLNLKHGGSLPKLSMTPQINLNDQPEGEATDVLRRDEAATQPTFNTLPAELRLKIYAMSWEPRRVILSRSWLGGPEDLSDYEFYARAAEQNVYDFFNEDEVTTVSTSTAPLPVTLWINQESRHETLRYYEIAFACPKNGSSQIYFNFRIDELEIRRHAGSLKSIISREELARLKALIVPAGYKEARSASNTIDKLSNIATPVIDLDGKIHQLHNLGLGLSAGLGPYDPGNPFEDPELRRLATRLQQELNQALDLPPLFSSACPSLERVRLEPTETCGFWPTEDFATPGDENDWFLRGHCECLTCTLTWTARQLGVLVANDPEEQAWSVGDACPPELGEDREVRLGKVTVTWQAPVEDTAEEPEEPEDDSLARRVVADWAVAATAVANKMTDPHAGEEPLYVI